MHRDLKPENIMVDADDRIKLIDFGIAGNEGSRRLTFAKLSNVMGTPDYISPEQVKGKRGDGRSDIYAMGVMLYEMLTGQDAVHRDRTRSLIMNDRLLNNPVPPREIDPSHLARAAGDHLPRASSATPKNRYATAREFAWDLEHQDQVGVAERAELRDWKMRKTGTARKILMYLGLALIPVVIFTLLLWVAKKA